MGLCTNSMPLLLLLSVGTSLSGGKGSVPLCIVGAIIVGVINNGLNLLGVDPYWQQVVKGLIIVLAVFLDQVKRNTKG